MSIKEYVTQAIEDLNETELTQLAEYLTFLRFRARLPVMPSVDKAQLAALYAEFGGEDRLLAEEGMEEYAAGLQAEDAK